MNRVEGGQHFRPLHDLRDTGNGQCCEPHQHDRTEQLSDGRRAVPLDQEECHQHADADRHDESCQPGRDDLHAFQRTEYRDRRRDDAIPVEQRGSENAQQQQCHAPLRGTSGGVRRECRQRHDAAFAAVVCPQDEEHVLQRHDEHQCPEDHRRSADDVRLVERDADLRTEDLVQRVEGTRPDVAIDNPQRTERQGKTCLGMCGRAHGKAPRAVGFVFAWMARWAPERRSGGQIQRGATIAANLSSCARSARPLAIQGSPSLRILYGGSSKLCDFFRAALLQSNSYRLRHDSPST